MSLPPSYTAAVVQQQQQNTIGFDILDNRYDIIRIIGQGSYGIVCAAFDKQTNKRVAIKKITTKGFSNVNQTRRILREIRILRQINHENILQIIDVLKPRSYDEFDDVYIVCELLDTDLHQIISSRQQLSIEHIQYFIYQIVRGIKYLHSANVLHRDLKPGNLLLNANCELRICDFGLARSAYPISSHNEFMTEYVATRWYRAPEIMLSWTTYNKAVDMWAIGCIFAELVRGEPLFPGRDYMDQLHRILDIIGTPSLEDSEFIASNKAKAYIRNLEPIPSKSFRELFPQLPPDGVDLIQRLLTFAPHKRITVDETLKHAFLRVLHDPTDEPIAAQPINFEFEQCPQTKEALKMMLWNELIYFHPEMMNNQPPPPPPPHSFMDVTMSNNNNNNMDMVSDISYDSQYFSARSSTGYIIQQNDFKSPPSTGMQMNDPPPYEEHNNNNNNNM